MPESTADNPVKVIDAVSMLYARSLMELAQEGGVVDEVAEELPQLVQLLAGQPDLAELFKSRAINTAARARSIEAIFKGRVSDLTYRFLQVLNDKGRLAIVPTIAAGYAKLLKDARGEVDVEVITARALSDAQLRAVGAKVGASVGGKALLSQRVDESILGGLKLRIGDKLIDGSVATQLQQIKRDMVARGREAVRSNTEALLSDE